MVHTIIITNYKESAIMKIVKLALLATAALGVSLFSAACATDEEQPDSRFWVNDKPVDGPGAEAGYTDPKLTAGDLSGIDGQLGDAIDSNQPGQYGDFTAEGSDYLEGFGKRITNAPAFQPVYFAFDTFAVPPTESSKVDAIAAFLTQNPGTGVVVEGNCDDRGTHEYNRALGERRALAVKTALQDRGITENRIATLSYGEEKPAVLGNTAEAWSRNRRADFVPVLLNAK